MLNLDPDDFASDTGGQTAPQVQQLITDAVASTTDGLLSPTTGTLAIQNLDAFQFTSILISGQLVSDSPTVTNTPAGFSGPLEYSWEGQTYIRIFADDGLTERVYLGTDLSFGNEVYIKTY